MEPRRHHDSSAKPPTIKRRRLSDDSDVSSDGSDIEPEPDIDAYFDEFAKHQFYKAMVENSLNMMIEASSRDAQVEAEAVSMAIKSHGLLFSPSAVPIPGILTVENDIISFTVEKNNGQGKKSSGVNNSDRTVDATGSNYADLACDKDDDEAELFIGLDSDVQLSESEMEMKIEGMVSRGDVSSEGNPLSPINFSPCTSREEVLSQALSAAIKTKGLGASDRHMYPTFFF